MRSPLTGDSVHAEWVNGDHEWTLFQEADGLNYVVSRRLLREHFADMAERRQSQYLETAKACEASGSKAVFVTKNELAAGIATPESVVPYRIFGIDPNS